MRKARSLVVIALVAAGPLVSPLRAPAAPNGPAEKSLDRCQNAVRTEGVKYVNAMQKAIGTCLGSISSEVVKKNAGVAGAVAACTRQFDRIARTDGKSLGDLFAARVAARCSPSPDNPHTLSDLIGNGFPGVAEPLRVVDLRELCPRFGTGLVDTASEWIDCVRGAQQCAVHDAIAAQFPRASTWLNDLAAAMLPSSARDAVLATEAAIDGTWNDGRPEGSCSVEVSAPGCSESLLSRQPDQVMTDLRTALAASDWDAVACNYHPAAFFFDDQGLSIGSDEVVSALMSLADFAGGSQPVIHEDNFFRNVVRVLYSLDAGWWRIEDGTTTYIVRRGRIVQQTTHGLITFTGPPPED